ncbi:MarR family transcriptional regulator [Actinoplanes sp. DH11]|uniref:MarR family transcriptional regulator n=1 Tax=Actinoplanes sp. DH11 TaxID=2857011 RepID=UPI001E365553|nr:MarR family transcriptional regulator [Actinoplanes sp. DH11]
MTISPAEPAAYWTGVAYQKLIAFTRARQAELGFTQPQLWLLRALIEGGDGRTVDELREAMRDYLRPEDDLVAEAETLLDGRLVAVDRLGRLRVTAAGREACERWRAYAPRIRARIHEGIDDAEYVAALAVLQRMIRNVS